MKRLNKKMLYWFKFILKFIPLWFFVFSFVNILFNETQVFDINDIIVDSLGTNNYFIIGFRSLSDVNGVDFPLHNIVNTLIRIVFDVNAGTEALVPIYTILYFVFASLIWGILIDFIDLVLHAFRFIIDFGHNIIDSFLDKSERGGR